MATQMAKTDQCRRRIRVLLGTRRAIRVMMIWRMQWTWMIQRKTALVYGQQCY